MSQKYSITPEGAKRIAWEIATDIKFGAEPLPMLTLESITAKVAAIILRHAEQSPEEKP